MTFLEVKKIMWADGVPSIKVNDVWWLMWNDNTFECLDYDGKIFVRRNTFEEPPFEALISEDWKLTPFRYLNFRCELLSACLDALESGYFPIRETLDGKLLVEKEDTRAYGDEIETFYIRS